MFAGNNKMVIMKPDMQIKEIESLDSCSIIHFSKTLGETDVSPFNVIHASIKPGGNTERDQHKVREYWFIAHGSGRLVLNDHEMFNVAKGELYYFDSMVSHQLFNLSDQEDLEILSMWW